MKKVRALSIIVALALLLGTFGAVGGSSTLSAQEGGGVSPQAAVTPLLQYQGRLTDPATGDPVEDGTYQISFRLYDVDAGGTPLWTETEDVPVQGGLFNNVLGDTTALTMALFNGQALWLAIKVGADAEATPRQPVLPVAYALSLVPGAVVGGPIQVAGNLDVAGSLTGAHASDPDAHHLRYTDPEAWNAVLSRDGPGSGLNADVLDGLSSASFASASHLHDGEDIQGGTIHEKYIDSAITRDTELESAITTHTHDARYYTEGESDSRFVNATGDTMTGGLTVPYVNYSSARTHYFAIPPEGFVPGSNVDYANTYGNGGAYIVSGSGALVAPVHLPHGAVVTSFTANFYDNSASDMTVWLDRQYWASGGFTIMAEVNTSGASTTYQRLTDSTIGSATVDNTNYVYMVYAYCNAWASTNLRIKGAVVTYTITQAP